MHTIAKPELLTDRQRELLRAAAANRGQLAVKLKPTAGGLAVWAGQKGFFNANDRDAAEQYIRTVNELVELQFLRGEGARKQYELTNSGWQISNKLGRGN